VDIIPWEKGFAVTETRELCTKAVEWRSRARSGDDRTLQGELVRRARLFEEAAERIDARKEAALSLACAGVGDA
jgi:hypothetical protein